MRSVYDQGIALYKQKKYRQALDKLTAACKVQGAPAWLYGEAHAMRGVIYHYFLKDRSKARESYRYSLEWDPKNKAANRHLHQVQ